MLGILEKYCPKCGYRIRVHDERFCHGCGLSIKKPKEDHLTEDDVKDISMLEQSPVDKIKQEKNKSNAKDTWLSVSYVIVGCSVIVTLLLVMAQIIVPMYLPIVIFSSLIGISLLDAFLPGKQKNRDDQFRYKPRIKTQKRKFADRREIYTAKRTKKLVYK